jgi:AcrR family transcriptional regulator
VSESARWRPSSLPRRGTARPACARSRNGSASPRRRCITTIPSKEQLLQAIVQPFFDDIRVLVGRAEQELPGGPALRSFFGAYLDMLLRHRTVCALFLRDASSIVAIVPLYKEALDLTRRLNSSIAGPDATDEQRLRTAAAFEVLGVALLSSSWLPDIPDDTVRKTLLDAAVRVLDGHDDASHARANLAGAPDD